MSNAARQVIQSFDALPERDQGEVLSQLLRRVVDTRYAAPADDELTGAADWVFQEYDKVETPG